MTIYTDMEERIYHARPELSSTGARTILDSPARFRYQQDHPRYSNAFDVGSAAHLKVLGVGGRIREYPDEHLTPSGNVSTKAATVAWEQEQRDKGLAVITPGQASAVDAMAEAVLAEPRARQILESIAGREVTVVADVDGVPSRARFDLYDGRRAGDLKTARDASPKGFNRAVGSHGYHIQQQWYEDVHHAETGAHLEAFTFIVVESAAPYLVGVYDLDFMWVDVAEKRTRQARELYARCVETGTWPGYGAVTLTPPTWAIYETEEDTELTL